MAGGKDAITLGRYVKDDQQFAIDTVACSVKDEPSPRLDCSATTKRGVKGGDPKFLEFDIPLENFDNDDKDKDDDGGLY